MIKIYIGQAFDPKEVIVSPDSSIRQIFKDNQVNAKGIFSWNSRTLGDAELEKPISALGIASGDMITVSDKLTGN